MALNLYRTRINSLRKLLSEKRLQSLIILSAENIRYLTGFTGHDSWLLVLPAGVILITDSRYTEQAKAECRGCKIIERKGSLVAAVADCIAKFPRLRKVGIENDCSLSVYSAVRKGIKKQIIPVNNLVESLTEIKDKQEITCIRRAVKIAWQALKETLSLANTGIKEYQLAAALDFNMKMLGSVPGFDTIVAFGSNGSRNHHQPGSRRLKKNDSILIDFGCKYNGYTCDITRCFAFGKPSAYFKKAYETVVKAQQTAIAMIAPGVKMADVDAACRKVIADNKLPVYGHGTGHGLGLHVHENPRISTLSKDEVFKPGQIITVEPGVYLPGKFGIRIEDDVLVTKTGHKILSQMDIDAIIPSRLPILKNRSRQR